jgi:hypothetical protein
MHSSTRLVLLGISVLTAFVIIAPLANAQVEVLDEPTSGHCSSIELDTHGPSGGCLFTASTVSSMVLYDHGNHIGNEMIVSLCTNQFTGAVDENGHGYAYNQTFSGPPFCAITACREGGVGAKKPWEFHVVEAGPASESFELEMCISPVNNPANEVYCEFHLAGDYLGNHNYRLSGTEAGGEDDGNHPLECEITGTWDALSNVEIIH